MIEISNTASAPVLVGLCTIIAAIGKVIVDLYQIKHKADDAKKTSAKAVENTADVSDRLARNVASKLDRIIAQQSDLDATLRDHLQWHVEQPPRSWKDRR